MCGKIQLISIASLVISWCKLYEHKCYTICPLSVLCHSGKFKRTWIHWKFIQGSFVLTLFEIGLEYCFNEGDFKSYLCNMSVLIPVGIVWPFIFTKVKHLSLKRLFDKSDWNKANPPPEKKKDDKNALLRSKYFACLFLIGHLPVQVTSCLWRQRNSG